MPNRILKESTLTSPNLNECSIPEQDLFKRILVMVDDYGCCEGNTPIIYGRGYSMCMDKVQLEDIECWKQELIEHSLIEIWDEGKREYIVIPNSEKHLFSKKCYTDEGNPTRHRRKTPEPPNELNEKKSQTEPERAKEKKVVPNPNPNPNKEKESQAPFNKKPKEDLPLEFDFVNKEWIGLYNWRIKRFSGKYPMLSINYLLEDEYKQKFLEKPKEYAELIKVKYNDKIEDLIWAWLGQEKKFYLRDHPDYQQAKVETVNKSSPKGMSHIGESEEVKKYMEKGVKV